MFKRKTSINTPCLAMRRPRAAEALDISPRLLAELTREGAIPHIKLTRRVILYHVAALEKWLSEQGSKGDRP